MLIVGDFIISGIDKERLGGKKLIVKLCDFREVDVKYDISSFLN